MVTEKVEVTVKDRTGYFTKTCQCKNLLGFQQRESSIQDYDMCIKILTLQSERVHTVKK